MTVKTLGITGGSGRIGQYVVARLQQAWHVRIIDLEPPADPLPNVTFARADITQPEALNQAIAGVDALVHLAAVDLDAHQNADQTFKVNALGSWNVLSACKANKVEQVVVCSSVTASGLPEMRDDWFPRQLPVTESHEDRPAHPYGVSKLTMETFSRSFTFDGDMSLVNLRVMMVALPENMPRLIDLSEDPAHRWTFSYISPEDLAAAFECALAASNIQYGVYYISADDTCTLEPTSQLVERVWGNENISQRLDQNSTDPRAALFSNDKAKRDLGFYPSLRWPDLLKQYRG